MIRIKVTNPAYEKEVEVVESIEDIEYYLEHVSLGYEPCVKCHTKDGSLFLFNPDHLATVEVTKITD